MTMKRPDFETVGASPTAPFHNVSKPLLETIGENSFAPLLTYSVPPELITGACAEIPSARFNRFKVLVADFSVRS